MKRVILESPWRGNVARNLGYLNRCLLDSVSRGEAPIASHKIFPGVLDDYEPEQREVGIESGLAWVPVAEKMVVYTDYGISDGMENAMSRARLHNIPIELRKINERGVKG